MDYLIIILFLVLIIILLISFYIKFILKKNYLYKNLNQSIEHFQNISITPPPLQKNTNLAPLDNNYLYPVCKLTDQCRTAGLRPALSPSICIKNGKIINDSNCACEDENGNCKICYDPIKEINSEATIVYNDNINMDYSAYSIKPVDPDLLIDKNFSNIQDNSPKNSYEELKNNFVSTNNSTNYNLS
jgi:tRNA U54 and U55 pseudouridine synthase Pus10